MFAPAYVKVSEIIKGEAFGGASSFCLRYPISLPDEERRDDSLAMSPFLEFVHPYSLLLYLFGECEGFSYMRSTVSGGLVMAITACAPSASRVSSAYRPVSSTGSGGPCHCWSLSHPCGAGHVLSPP